MEDSDRSFWEGINVEGMVTDWIADNAAEFHNESPTLKRRRASKQPKIDYWKTKWGQLLLNDQICNPFSAAAKKFRRRFRVPYPVFHEIIVPRCIEKNIFGNKEGQENKIRIPIEFKILIALRVLGRGNCFDDIAELADTFESTAHAVFKQFVWNFAKEFFADYVKVPTGDRLKKTMAVYEQLGLPGAVGSMDCTHLRWNKCPKWLHTLCKGKEGYPSLAFNCVVDHFRLIHHVSEVFVGTSNDITICHNDTYTRNIVMGLYVGIVFFIFLANGLLQKCCGAWK